MQVTQLNYKWCPLTVQGKLRKTSHAGGQITAEVRDATIRGCDAAQQAEESPDRQKATH